VRPIRVFSILALMLAASASAQNQQNVAPAKPYRAVSIKPPQPINDPAFDALRKQLADIAERKDRAALSQLVVTLGFFWDRENGDGANKHKSGVDNLAIALGLDNKEDAGWDMLATFAVDPTASPSPNHRGAICAPADPGFNGKELNALIDATDTDPSEWGYPVSAGIDVHSAGEAGAPVIDKLGLYFVRVMPETVASSPSYIRIVMPSGKTGYVTIDSIAAMGNDQLCYLPGVHGGWKIGGYVGGGEPQ
jgi:hypothetical protein